ncbi:MAG: 50S ribosomal protein L4 [Rhodospirillaceae bacterium]
MKQDIISLANKKVGDIDLDDAVFGVDIRADLMARTVNWQLAKRRAGTHKVKGRSEINGTKAKPFRQKGTGRARQGTRYAPQMRGGGIVFGPEVRDHGHSLPKKVRALALKSALSAKQKEGKLFILDSAAMKAPKTRELAKQLEKLNWGRVLVIDGETVDENFARAAANLIGVDVLPTAGANVYDILRRETLVITQAGVDKLTERLK